MSDDGGGGGAAATELFHLAERRDWLAARAAGEYRMSTRGVTLAEQGFIHCSLRHQVRGVAQAFYADAGDLVLLRIDPRLVGHPVRFEAAAPGAERYPHIYGPLPVAAVTEALPVARDQSGRLVLPG